MQILELPYLAAPQGAALLLSCCGKSGIHSSHSSNQTTFLLINHLFRSLTPFIWLFKQRFLCPATPKHPGDYAGIKNCSDLPQRAEKACPHQERDTGR